MKSNKSKSRFGGAAIIYLLVLLMLVVLYLGVAYPKLNDQIADINQNINKLTNEINMLAPYASQLASLTEKAEKAEKQFENNTELDKPVMFSNIIYKSADQAGVTVVNLNVAVVGIVETESKYESQTYTASISVTATNRYQLEQFVSQLEQNEGSAMSMQSVSYSQSEGAITAEITILMYAVSK